MFEPIRKWKDKVKDQSGSEQIKEDKHFIKIGSIKPHKGHTLFKVIEGEIVDVEPEDFIESRIYLKFINPDGRFDYSISIKMKQGRYISALNKSNAKKQL